jgi:hypothetical protein
MNAVFSESESDVVDINKGIPTITVPDTLLITLTISEIIRKDQKFWAPLLKNSPDAKRTLSFLTIPNKPPVRKALRMVPAIKTIIKPVVKAEIILLITGPRSENTSMSIPALSFSVIILEPKDVPRELLKG